MTTLHDEPSAKRALDTDRPTKISGSRSDRFAFYYFMASIVAGVLAMLALAFIS